MTLSFLSQQDKNLNLWGDVYFMKKKYLIGDDFVINFDCYCIIKDDKKIQLSHKEAEVLNILCSNSLCVVERKFLLESIWKGSESGDIGLNKTILMLRRKFESLGIKKIIQTVPRIGYIFLLEGTAYYNSKAHSNNSKDIISKEVTEEKNKTAVGIGKNIINNILDMTLTRGLYKKIKLVTVAIVIILMLCLYFFSNFIMIDDKLRLKSEFFRYNGEFGSVFMARDIKKGGALGEIVKSIEEVYREEGDKKIYYILATKENISVVSISPDGVPTSIIFPHSHSTNSINEDLLCAVSHLKKGGYLTKPKSFSSNGFNFISMRFLNACEDDEYLVDLTIKRSGHRLKLNKILQHISARNSKGVNLFHFDMTSEREEKHYNDGGIEAYFYNSPASLIIDQYEQVGKSDYILNVISGFTSAYMRQAVIDTANKVFMSDAMGGILYVAY